MDQIGPVADRPVISNCTDRRHAGVVGRPNAGRTGQRVLRMKHVDLVQAKPLGKNAVELIVEPFVLEVIAHVRHGRRPDRHFDGLKALVGDAFRRRLTHTRTHEHDLVSASSQPLGELIRAPSASAADWRKCIGRYQDAHALTFAITGRMLREVVIHRRSWHPSFALHSIPPCSQFCP